MKTNQETIVAKLKLPLSLCAAVWGCGFLSMVSMPFLIGALVSNNLLNESSAGIVGTLELGVIASVAFLLSSRIGRWPLKSVAFYGALVTVFGHTASIFCDSFYQLLVARTIAGLGAGFALVAGQQLVSHYPDSGRLSAIMMVFTGLFLMALYLVLGFNIERWGVVGAYGTEAVWVLAMIPLIRMLPLERPVVDKGEVVQGSIWGKTGLVALCLFLFSVVDSSVWAFSERVGNSLGMGSDEVSYVMGINALAGLAGAFAATYLGIKLGRTLPIFIGLALYATCGYLIYSSGVVLLYSVGLIFLGMMYMFSIPYLYGIAGDIDASGKTIAVASGAALVGCSVGPYLSAAIFSSYGFYPIGVFVVAGMSVVFLIASECCKHMNATSLVPEIATGKNIA